MMKLKFYYYWAFCLCFLGMPTIQAQEIIRCFTDEMTKIRGLEKSTAPPSFKQLELLEEDRLIVIPVVVHVVHENGVENIDDEIIKSQIEVLNEDFGRYGNGFNEHAVGTDTKIRFCLAKKDPDGHPTSGITRVESPFTVIRYNTGDERLLKQQTAWDQKRYMNIWVVRDIDNDNPSSTVQGFSYLTETVFDRVGNPLILDGIVMNYRFFGKSNFSAFFNQGRTCTHEVGHYLNLRHPWGGTDGNGGCDDDDLVDDTPLCIGPFQASTRNNCPTPIQCEEERMTENYMDYSEDGCMNIFTQGQNRRMRAAIQRFRGDLVNPKNLEECGCLDTYNEWLVELGEVAEEVVNVQKNRTQDEVILKTSLTEESNFTIELINLKGQILFQKQQAFPSGTNFTPLSLGQFPQGLYIIKITRPNGLTHTEKVVLY